MKTLVRIACAAVIVLLVSLMYSGEVQARHSHGGARVGVWIGPGWIGPGWGAWGTYPYYSYPYYPYYREPQVIVQQPEVYVQPAPPQEQEQTYWYFCKEPQGYYPYVKQCPTGWLKVVPSPPGPSTSPP